MTNMYLLFQHVLHNNIHNLAHLKVEEADDFDDGTMNLAFKSI